MGKHARRAADRRYLRLVAAPADELEVRRTGVHDLQLVEDHAADPHAADDQPGRPDDPGRPDEPGRAGEPAEYGVRVNWQSEAVKIEAAEFLIATRMQQDARLRASHVLAGLRRRQQHSSR